VEGAADDIVWKFTTSEKYTVAAAYKVQFESMTHSYMPEAAYSRFPKMQAFFACLILQDWMWTNDRPQRH
jgi:uncharacterized protein YpbB